MNTRSVIRSAWGHKEHLSSYKRLENTPRWCVLSHSIITNWHDHNRWLCDGEVIRRVQLRSVIVRLIRRRGFGGSSEIYTRFTSKTLSNQDMITKMNPGSHLSSVLRYWKRLLNDVALNTMEISRAGK